MKPYYFNSLPITLAFPLSLAEMWNAAAHVGLVTMPTCKKEQQMTPLLIKITLGTR